MGKTSKPLTIVAFPPCDGWEELIKLEKQGHTVHRIFADQSGGNSVPVFVLLDADIVLGPQCWRMSNAHKPYLTLAIKEARMIRYPTYEKRADSKTRASIAADLDVDSDKSSTD